MPRLRDLGPVLRSLGPLGFARRVWGEISQDNLFTWAAALAYSWLFAIFPFLIFLIGLVPYLPEQTKDKALGEIHQALYYSLPAEAADTLWQNIKDVLSRPRTGLLSLGLIVTIWAASGGMAMTMSALDKCYEREEGRPFYKLRPLAVMLTIVVATLILTVLVLLPIGSLVRNWVLRYEIAYLTRGLVLAMDLTRWFFGLAAMFMAVALVYYFGPDVRQRFRVFSPGSVFTVAVWIALGLIFKFYIERFGKYNQTYGTVGGVAVLLLVFYVDAVVLLVGAEINSEIDFEVLKVPRGSRDLRRAEG